MVRLTVLIDESEDARLRAEAKHRGVSVAKVVRGLIDERFPRPRVDIPRWQQLFEEIDAEPLPPGMSIDDYLYGSHQE